MEFETFVHASKNKRSWTPMAELILNNSKESISKIVTKIKEIREKNDRVKNISSRCTSRNQKSTENEMNGMIYIIL